MPADVIEATRAEVSMERLALSNAAHSSPFEDIPVLTMVTDPGLDAYSVPLPLRTHSPPARPSVYGVKAAALQVLWPLWALTTEHCAAQVVSLSVSIGLPMRSSEVISVSQYTR
jgi:hypothetical protein